MNKDPTSPQMCICSALDRQ